MNFGLLLRQVVANVAVMNLFLSQQLNILVLFSAGAIELHTHTPISLMNRRVILGEN